jgi:hypothetical protein
LGTEDAPTVVVLPAEAADAARLTGISAAVDVRLPEVHRSVETMARKTHSSAVRHDFALIPDPVRTRRRSTQAVAAETRQTIEVHDTRKSVFAGETGSAAVHTRLAERLYAVGTRQVLRRIHENARPQEIMDVVRPISAEEDGTHLRRQRSASGNRNYFIALQDHRLNRITIPQPEGVFVHKLIIQVD